MLQMRFHQAADKCSVLIVGWEQLDRMGSQLGSQSGLRIIDIGDATGHAGRKVAADRPQDERCAAGHIFTAVVTHPFHHNDSPAVAHTEPLPGKAADKAFSRGGAEKGHIADDDIVLGRKGGAG